MKMFQETTFHSGISSNTRRATSICPILAYKSIIAVCTTTFRETERTNYTRVKRLNTSNERERERERRQREANNKKILQFTTNTPKSKLQITLPNFATKQQTLKLLTINNKLNKN